MGCVQGFTPRIKCPGKTKTKLTKLYLRAFVTLSSPHDQRRQRGGRRREGGVSRGAKIPEVYWVVTQCERRNPKAWAQL